MKRTCVWQTSTDTNMVVSKRLVDVATERVVATVSHCTTGGWRCFEIRIFVADLNGLFFYTNADAAVKAIEEALKSMQVAQGADIEFLQEVSA